MEYSLKILEAELEKTEAEKNRLEKIFEQFKTLDRNSIKAKKRIAKRSIDLRAAIHFINSNILINKNN